MKLDPRRLSPGQLCQLLNSSSLGQVVTSSQLARLRQQAGWRVGDGKKIDLLKWAAWCFQQVEAAPPSESEVDNGAEARGDRHRKRMAERSRKAHAAKAEIGPIPPPKDPERRKRCLDGPDALLNFCREYFAVVFSSPFSADHIEYIRRLQDTITHGGRDLQIVYRGFGKTAILEAGVLWGAVKGIRRCLLFLGADDNAALDSLESLKTDLETNDALAEDFPEVCFPIWALGGKPQGANSQTCEGKRTHIRWKKDRVVLPSVTTHWNGETIHHAGAAIICKGLPKCKRGTCHKTTKGERVRPDFIAIDDMQTDDSALSGYQCSKLLQKLYRTVLKLGGHQRQLACAIAGTILRPGDAIDQLCDVEQHGSWRANICKMVFAWSQAHDTHWLSSYADLRRSFDRKDPASRQRAWRKATAYYLEHRTVMDEGCEVAWDYCFSPEHEEVSAIQHAYNALIDDGLDAFLAEMQNTPEESGEDAPLSTSFLIAKRSGLARGCVPTDVAEITAFIDVHGKILVWTVCGFTRDFSGYILDWGAWPKQDNHYFSKQDARVTLRKQYKATETAAIYAGLEACAEMLLTKRYPRMRGGSAVARSAIRLLLVDTGWNAATVYRWASRSKWWGQIMPSKGKGVTAKERPIGEWTAQDGDRLGDEWLITPAGRNNRPCPLITIDVNEWKTRAYQGLMLPLGASESIVLPEAPGGELQLVADHLCAERQDRVQVRDRVKVEWREPGHRPDNEIWDGLVGCMVGANVCGITTARQRLPSPKKKVRRRGPRVRQW